MIKIKFSAFICILTLFLANICFAQQIAITIDNPNVEKKPLVSAKGRDKSILAALNKHHLKTILFVQGSQVNSPAGRALLQRWSEAGQLFGNHTYTHRNFNEVPVDEYESDTLRDEALLASYPNFTKIFRFPFLKEGDTAESRDDFRTFLHDHDYQIGSVTIDTSDSATDWKPASKKIRIPTSIAIANIISITSGNAHNITTSSHAQY